jgi:hypothetical protein
VDVQESLTTITGLASGTTYHARVSATNQGGTANTADVVFTTISTEARLSALSPSAGTLSPAFNNNTISYTSSTPETNIGTYALTATRLHPAATIELRANGAAFAPVVSGTAQVVAGLHIGSNSIDVRVTAEDTVTVKTYTIALTVTDVTPPTVTGTFSPLTLTTGVSGFATLPNYVPQAVATDNVGVTSVTQSPTPGTVPPGIVHVVITAKDAANNAGTKAFDVTVNDGTPPSLSVPPDQTAEATSAAGAVVNYPAATGSDNSGAPPTISYTKPPGSQFALGTTVVTATATDAANNNTSKTFNVLVRDTTPPTITVKPPDRTIAAGANATAPLPDLVPELGASDNVAVATKTQSPLAGTVRNLGNTVVTLTVTDTAGLSVSTTVNVTVADQTPPTVNAPAGGFTPLNIATGFGGTVALPNYAVQATATDNVGVTGAITQSPAAGTLVAFGTTHVVITARDAANNPGTLALDVNVTDGTLPVLAGPLGGFTPLNVLTGVDGNAILPSYIEQASATDNVAVVGAITQLPAPGTPKAYGPVNITLSARDAAGNVGTMNFLVNIDDGTLPNITTVPADRTLAAGATGTAPLPDLVSEVAATDNVGVAINGITQTPAAATVFDVGLHDVIITVVDDAGNAAHATVHITVTDQSKPVVHAPVDGFTPLTVATGVGGVVALPNYAAQATATDNVGVIGGVTQSPAAGLPQSVGTTAITLSAADAAGNTGTLSFNLIVTDGTGPVITTAPADRTLNLGATSTIALPDLTGEVVATDNVAVAATTQTPLAGTQLGVGSNNVVVKAADEAGNFTEVTVKVLVKDVTAPELRPTGGQFTPLTIATGVDGTVALPDYIAQTTVTDNVAVVGSVTQLPLPGTSLYASNTLAQPNPVHVVLSATDAAGNTGTVEFAVTVTDGTPPTLTGDFSPLILNTTAAGSVALPDYVAEANVADNLPGATLAQSPPANTLVAAGHTTVTLTATDVAGNTFSTSFDVEVRLFPQITAPPAAFAVRPKANVTFSVTAAGYGTLGYQWLKDAVELPGQTASTLALTNVQTANVGNYTVRVTNSIGSATSAPAALRLIVWDQVDGTYQSLLTHDNTGHPAEPAYPGRLTATLTPAGALSGKLEYRGLNYVLTGAFTPELNYDKTFTLKNTPAVRLQMHMDANALTVTAKVTESLSPAPLESGSVLEFHTVHTAKSPAAQTGRFTARLNPTATTGVGPTAAGYATINVTATGSVTYAGKLADGTTLGGSALLKSDGSFACYQALYPHVTPYAGYLNGPITVAPAGGLNAVSGPLEWVKPAQTSGAFYRAGFTQALAAEGSRYIAPPAGQRVLTIAGGGDALAFSADAVAGFDPVHLSTANAFTVDKPNTNKLTLTLTKATGLIHGTFVDPVLRKTRTIDGVTLQAQDEFSGLFLRESDSAQWRLAP